MSTVMEGLAAVLDAPAPSHSNGPETERLAARKLASARLNRLRKMVAELFIAAGPSGLAPDEICELIDDEYEYTLRPRVTELKKAGLLTPTGARRTNRRGGTEDVLRWVDGAAIPSDSYWSGLARPKNTSTQQLREALGRAHALIRSSLMLDEQWRQDAAGLLERDGSL
jgi:hypothetical protein